MRLTIILFRQIAFSVGIYNHGNAQYEVNKVSKEGGETVDMSSYKLYYLNELDIRDLRTKKVMKYLKVLYKSYMIIWSQRHVKQHQKHLGKKKEKLIKLPMNGGLSN